MKTIMVKTWNGERELTKDQFVQRWTEQVSDLWAICYTDDDYKTAERIRVDLANLAGNAFDTLYLDSLKTGEVA